MRAEPTGKVKNYLDFIREGAPKCCHTCEKYNEKGFCIDFLMQPPPEFTNEIDKCPAWVMEIPF